MEELLVLESDFLALNKIHLISELELKKIIHIVINRILDFMSDETSDYRTYVHEDLLCIAYGVERCCNPYVNPELYEYLQNQIALKNKDNYDKIFKNVLLCLSRILESIDYWYKELGADGYFRFIEQFINLDEYYIETTEFFFNDETLDKDLK